MPEFARTISAQAGPWGADLTTLVTLHTRRSRDVGSCTRRTPSNYYYDYYYYYYYYYY